MRWTWLPLSLIPLVVMALALPAVTAPLRRASGDGSVTVRPRTLSDVANLEIGVANAASAGVRRMAVSDLVVRLKPAGEGPLATVLGLADGDRAGRGRVLFEVEILVVANGRLLIEERARCAPWTAGASLCRTECDGGVFALLRSATERVPTLRLRLGRVDAAEGAGVRLGACSDREGDEISLMARRGLATVEIDLAGD